MIEAFIRLRTRHPELRLRLLNAVYPVPESQHEADACRALIARHPEAASGIELVTDYLAEEEVLARLAAADLVLASGGFNRHPVLRAQMLPGADGALWLLEGIYEELLGAWGDALDPPAGALRFTAPAITSAALIPSKTSRVLVKFEREKCP